MPAKPLFEITNTGSTFSLRELYAYRELFWILAWRDFRVRYAQTVIGILWSVIQPVTSILILFVVFGKFAAVDTNGIHHLLFTTCGLMPWTYFAFVMQNSGSSIIGSQSMVKKIYFPRIIIPLSKSVVGLIDFGINGLILIGLLIYFQFLPSANIVYLPIFVLLALITALSTGILLSALTVRFRDFQHIVPFLIQLGLYVTPTAYPADIAISKLPAWASGLYFLNPMAGVVEGFRWAVLGTPFPAAQSFISFAMIAVLLVVALYYFKKVDGKIADIV